MRALGRKNTWFFSGNALLKSNARVHLKQRKKHSGFRPTDAAGLKSLAFSRTKCVTTAAIDYH